MSTRKRRTRVSQQMEQSYDLQKQPQMGAGKNEGSRNFLDPSPDPQDQDKIEMSFGERVRH